MQFTSGFFLLFLLVFFLLWPGTAGRIRFRWGFLVGASFFFYGWANWQFVPVLAAVGLLSFLSGLGIERLPGFKRSILLLGLSGNLGILLFYKYSPWIIETLKNLPGFFGQPINSPADILIFHQTPPLGISFYTLQAMSYILDTYHRRIPATRNLLHFFAYLSLFPKLISGPIERGKDLLPQLAASQSTDEAQRWEGLKLILSGYFLKSVLADNLAPVVDTAFSATPFQPSALYWWTTITAFAFQLYCDFSGYTRIALGLALWMGLRLTDNFKHPYRSASIGEFWTRWHISFSNWLRDYIFYPLGRSRLGRGHPHINMWITMLISGLWHGAGWTYLAWGACHASFISLERWSSWPNHLKKIPFGRGIAVLLTLLQLWIAWVFFRASSLPQAWLILRTMFSFSGPAVSGLDLNSTVFFFTAIFWEFSHLYPLRKLALKPLPWARALEVTGYAALLVATVYLRGQGSEFIYFQF